MKLATQDRPLFGTSFENKLGFIQKFGFDGLELSGEVLIDRFAEIKAAVKSTSMKISSVCGGYRGWIGHYEQEQRERAIRDIGEIMKYTAEIGAEGVIAPAAFGMFSKKLPPFSPPRSEEADREILLDSLSRINELGKKTGSILFLEPLNRYEDNMINRIEHAVSLIEAGAFTHIKAMADFFHMHMEEADLAKSILDNGNYIAHVHLADSNRLEPGKGHLDFVSGFKALRQIGFKGYMSIECGLSVDNEQAYVETAAYLKSCLEQSK